MFFSNSVSTHKKVSQRKSTNQLVKIDYKLFAKVTKLKLKFTAFH